MGFYKIRPRSGTTAQWETANTVLGEREIGFEYTGDTVGKGLVKMKMGDGITPWNSLPYAILDSATATQVKQMLDDQTNVFKPIIDGVSNAVNGVKSVVDSILTKANDTNGKVGTINSVLVTVNKNVSSILNKLNSGGTSVIKSIQRGEAHWQNSDLTYPITIKAVEPTKSIVIFNLAVLEQSAGNYYSPYHVEFVNNTTIRFKRYYGNKDDDTYIGWQVIEFV